MFSRERDGKPPSPRRCCSIAPPSAANKEWATRRSFPSSPHCKGWQPNGNNHSAVSGCDTLIKGMWASHSRLPSPTWVLKMYPRANPALRIGGFHTPWFRAAFKQLGRQTHIFVLVVNPSSPGKTWFIFPPLSLLKVLFYSHLHSTPVFIAGMWEAQSSQ